MKEEKKMKPVKANDLLQLDKRMKVVMLRQTQLPQTLVWQAGKNDYSEEAIHTKFPPNEVECGNWVVERLLANERGHWGCYSSDTEVLTEDGWIFWNEVTENTVLAAYNIQNGLVGFEKPSAVQRWDYNGKMYSLKGQALDFLVSPDHRMIVQNRKNNSFWTESYAISAEEVYGKSVRYITTGNLLENERTDINIPVENPLFWSLIGFWIGDGDRYHSSNTIKFHLKLSKKIEYLKSICDSLNIDFHSTENDRYSISYPNIGNWMRDNCLDEEQNKKIPNGFMRLNTDSVKNLFDGLRNSNGTTHRNTWGYSTTSKILCNQIQALASVNNLKFTVALEKRNNENHKDLYRLRLTNRIYPRVEISQNTRSRTYAEEWVDYEGQIHCATVSTGALIVRRNGKVAICGNCLEHPSITFDCVGFVHNVVVQARTHRVGVSFDVQSQRYTGRRVLKVADGKLPINEVFYVRPVGLYLDRKGHKYEWTEENYSNELKSCLEASKRYSEGYEKGMAEEHLRDYLPQNIRQNFVVSFSLRAALHFLDLRAKLDAQLEIQALCEGMVPLIKEWVPEIFSYYEQKRLHKARLSP
jgi:thymidylate synthase (FAD)